MNLKTCWSQQYCCCLKAVTASTTSRLWHSVLQNLWVYCTVQQYPRPCVSALLGTLQDADCRTRSVCTSACLWRPRLVKLPAPLPLKTNLQTPQTDGGKEQILLAIFFFFNCGCVIEVYHQCVTGCVWKLSKQNTKVINCDPSQPSYDIEITEGLLIMLREL